MRENANSTFFVGKVLICKNVFVLIKQFRNVLDLFQIALHDSGDKTVAANLHKNVRKLIYWSERNPLKLATLLLNQCARV